MKLSDTIAIFFLISAVAASKPTRHSGLLYYHDAREASPGGNRVTYDSRSFMIDGMRTLLLSGAVHYPRVAAGEWSNIFKVCFEVPRCSHDL